MDKIEERVRKLLALASNNSNPAEAEAAAAKARELMLQHAIDEGTVNGKVPDIVIVNFNVQRRFYAWQRYLMAAVAELFDGRLLWTETWSNKGDRKVDVAMFVVAKYDEAAVIPTYVAVNTEITKAAVQYPAGVKKNSFILGASVGFLNTVRAAAEAKMPTKKMNEIVKVRKASVNDYIENTYGELEARKGPKPTEVDGESYNQGVDFGKGINANQDALNE